MMDKTHRCLTVFLSVIMFTSFLLVHYGMFYRSTVIIFYVIVIRLENTEDNGLFPFNIILSYVHGACKQSP